MKVVNIVPEDTAEHAKEQVFAAIDWSLQRWYEEGRESEDDVEEGDGDNDNDVEDDIARERGRRLANVTIQEEEEEEEDDEDDDEDDEPPVEEYEEEEEEEEEEDENDIHSPAHDPMQELGEFDEEEEEVDEVSHGRAPVGDTQLLGEDTLSHGRSPVRVGGGNEEGPTTTGLVLPVASFTSGYPPTPGRGFRHDDVARLSDDRGEHEKEHQHEEHRDGIQPSPQLGLEEGMPTIRFTSKPAARKKVKASRKGRKQPSRGGEASRSLEDSAPTSEDVVGEGEGEGVGDIPLIDTQSQNVEPVPAGVERAASEPAHEERVGLNVSSPVEEVAAAVLEVLGQGHSNVDPPAAVVDEDTTAASPSNEAEVVIRTEVICLDSDDDVPERRVELDVRVKVKDRVPYRVRGTFADYMTDDSEDEGYGTPEYNRVKLSFVDDPHPVFATRPQSSASDKGKESDLKDKVHFAPFVDKYLSEVPENVRLNLAHMYKSYDYHKMFAYLSTPAFCQAVKVKHILHAASLKKMRKRWTAFDVPPPRHGREHHPGSSAAQAQSVVDSTLEIIDISGVQESPSREANVGAAESSSPRRLQASSPVRVDQGPQDLVPHAQGTYMCC
jgi:hypothetical protein